MPPRSGVRSPSASARSTADSTAAAWASMANPWRSIIAADRNIASGLAAPVPAMSGAEPWTGSNTPGPSASPSEALGSIPIEPVSIAASSLRMSPNMFSVRITSKCRGAAISCIAALSTSRCSSSMFGNSVAWTSRTTSRHSRLVSSTLALSTLVTRDFAAVERDPGDPLDLLARVHAVVGRPVGRAGLLAEVDAAGELADHRSGRSPRSARA